MHPMMHVGCAHSPFNGLQFLLLPPVLFMSAAQGVGSTNVRLFHLLCAADVAVAGCGCSKYARLLLRTQHASCIGPFGAQGQSAIGTMLLVPLPCAGWLCLLLLPCTLLL